MRRLARAGFKKEFIHPAILPDWWDDSCADDPGLLRDVEIRVARFLGLPLAVVTDASASLASPPYPQAQLRRTRDIDRSRLEPAIHSATKIAAAVVRSLRYPGSGVSLPPKDGLSWRAQIQRGNAAVTLHDAAAGLWQRGIPVVPLEVLPTPRFQGVASIVEDRPVVLLGHKHDEPGRAAFLIAHEAGHVAASDCAPGRPVIDEEEEVADDTEIEQRADQFASHLLIGKDPVPTIVATGFRELAHRAAEIERETGADASAVIFAWARRSGQYATATRAVQALYRGTGARKQLRRLFDDHVDLGAASESDRALLRCVYGDPERDEGPP